MKNRKIAISVLVVFLVVVALALAWTRSTSGKTAAPSENGATTVHLVYARPVRRDFQVTLPWTGRVESVHCVRLIALVDGRVQSIGVPDETAVASGAPLFETGGPTVATARRALAAAVQSATARLKTARETLKRKQQGLKAAEKALDARTRALAAQLALAKQTAAARKLALGQHLGTAEQVALAQAEVDRLTAELSTARLQEDQLPAADDLASAEQQVRGLESALAAARAKLDDLAARTHLSAPFAGVFTERRVHVGQTVRSGDVLAAVIDPHHLRIVATLFAPAGVALTQGMKADVRLPGTGNRLPVAVSRVVAEATPAGAAMLWLTGVEIDNRLRPGATASGRLTLTERRGALAVPRGALVYDAADTPFLFVRHAGGCRKVRVRTGAEQDAWVEIADGLQENQAVVVQGAYELYYASFSQVYKIAD